VPSEFCLDYKSLISELKKEIPNFKQNNQFHQIKNKLLQDNSELLYIRKLDKKIPKALLKNIIKKNLLN